MNYGLFGSLGWKVSELGFGAWAIGGDMWGPQADSDSIAALNKAIDLGVNFIDTAQGYGMGHSEDLIGAVLQGRRETVFVATKVPMKPGSPWPLPLLADSEEIFPRKYVIEECEKSLRRLHRDYIDVYQFHTWSANFNQQTEWFEAVCRLKQDGKIRAFGVSVPDTNPECVVGGVALGRVDAVQTVYNIFEQFPQQNLFPVCTRVNAAVIARVPFDEGALTGKFTDSTVFASGDIRSRYFRGTNLKRVVERVNAIRRFKEKRYPDISMAEYALRFCVSSPGITTVIPGMRTPAQVEENVRAAQAGPLDLDEIAGLKAHSWRKDFWHQEEV